MLKSQKSKREQFAQAASELAVLNPERFLKLADELLASVRSTKSRKRKR